jgi:hypothetical protein
MPDRTPSGWKIDLFNNAVFRGVCAFFIGQPKHICQPRILPLPS